MNRLIVFAKYPSIGRVKTRLARDLGEAKALEIYRWMLSEVVARTFPTSGQYEFILSFDPPAKREAFADLYPQFFQYWSQGEGDLGARMGGAFKKSFHEGTSKTLIIGSDCPALEEAVLLEAFALLDASDLVFGPSLDGGYYLIGAKKYHPNLFVDILWSSSVVLEKSLQKAQGEGLSYQLLGPLGDIDQAEDYWRAVAP